MTNEEQEVVRLLVDVRPVYNVMPIATAQVDADSFYTRAERAYVLAKLRKTAKALRETAKYIDRKLKESRLAKATQR